MVNNFAKFFFFLLIVFSCSNVHSSRDFTKTNIQNDPYDSLRQNIRDSLRRGLKNVNDYYNLYTDTQRVRLDSIITNFGKSTKLNITIITFDSTMSSADSVEIVTKIIGIKNKINTTIGISPTYRKMYIWNDSLVNNTVFTSHEAKEVIETKFIPAFRQENYYEGTLQGLVTIISTIKERTSINF